MAEQGQDTYKKYDRSITVKLLLHVAMTLAMFFASHSFSEVPPQHALWDMVLKFLPFIMAISGGIWTVVTLILVVVTGTNKGKNLFFSMLGLVQIIIYPFFVFTLFLLVF